MSFAKIAVPFLAWFLMTQFARAASAMAPADVRAIVEQINAAEFGGWFDPADVLAVVEIESSFIPDAVRHEPHINDSSIGLMQVLYTTAVDRGLVGGPAALFDPVVNIRMGMRQLKWSFDYLAGRLGHAPELAMWIGSYNAGVGNALNGRWVQSYVDKFVRARGRYS